MRFLCLRQSPRLYGTSISEETRPKSSQSIDLTNDRRKDMNLLERPTNTCLTKAAFSPLCGRLLSCKEATISIS